MDYDAQRVVQQELRAGERLLWSGQPAQGVRLQPGDVLMIPFSLVWTGFACFWVWSAVQSGAPLLFSLFGVPFILVGLYIVLGRFVAEARRRARTYYGITTERAVILRAGGRREITSLDIRSLNDIQLREGSRRAGTIVLKPTGAGFGNMTAYMGAGWPGASRFMPPAFEQIPDVRAVYELLHDARKEAEASGSDR